MSISSSTRRSTAKDIITGSHRSPTGTVPGMVMGMVKGIKREIIINTAETGIKTTVHTGMINTIKAIKIMGMVTVKRNKATSINKLK